MRRLFLVGCLAAAVLGMPAFAADDVLLRSDLPLWNESDEGVSPWACGDIGRCTDFAMGYWQAVGGDWIAFRIAGPFHGTYSITQARSEKGLMEALPNNGIMVALGETPSGKRLYALQIGFRGGSTFWLLSAEPPNGSITKKFKVLDVRCEDGGEGTRQRRWDGGATYRTDYCAVSSREALRNMALAAAKRKPVTDLVWVHDAPDEK